MAAQNFLVKTQLQICISVFFGSESNWRTNKNKPNTRLTKKQGGMNENMDFGAELKVFGIFSRPEGIIVKKTFLFWCFNNICIHLFVYLGLHIIPP